MVVVKHPPDAADTCATTKRASKAASLTLIETAVSTTASLRSDGNGEWGRRQKSDPPADFFRSGSRYRT